MRKMKNSILLLLTLLVIAVGAYLPRIIAAAQDGKTMDKVSFDTVRPVQLEIRKDIPSLGKLALLNRLDRVIEIPQEATSMTPEEAEKAAYAALEPYLEAGIMDSFETQIYEIRPLLGQTSDDPGLNSIFWDVTILSDPDVYFLSLAIDDATGRLLRINYWTEYPIEESARDGILAVFSDLYFNGLEITDYGDYETDDLEDQYIGDSVIGVRYRFGDLVYGEINVDLYAFEYGFYTEFPAV